MTDLRYSPGNCSVSADGTIVTFSSAQMLQHAMTDDKISINRRPSVEVISVISQTQLEIEPWPYATVTAVPYILFKNSSLRTSRGQVAAAMTTLIERLKYTIVFVPAGASEPDPSEAEPGLLAYQADTKKWWRESGGVWVLDTGPGTGDVKSNLANTFTNTTDASSSTVGGAMTIAGGLAVAKKLFVGALASLVGLYIKAATGVTTITIQDSAPSHTTTITSTASAFRIEDNAAPISITANTNSGRTNQLLLNGDGSISTSGALGVAGALNVDGVGRVFGDFTVGNGGSTFLKTNLNNGPVHPASGLGLAIGSNFASGSAEVNFWNTYIGASLAFDWRQLKASGTSSSLMYLSSAGALTVPGSITGGSLNVSGGTTLDGVNITGLTSSGSMRITSPAAFVSQMVVEDRFAGASGGYLNMQKWRTGGANNGAVLVNDTIGTILFAGKDQSGVFQNAAYVNASVETVGSNFVTGRLDWVVGGQTLMTMRGSSISVYSGLASTASTNGALAVTGGVGIGGRLNVGGAGAFAGDLSAGGAASITAGLSVGGTGAFGGNLTVATPSAALELNDTGSSSTFVRFKQNGAAQRYLQQTVGSFYVANSNGSAGVVLSGDGATSWSAFSDRRIKDDVETLDVLSHLESFRAVRYFNRMSGSAEIGIIAQEQHASWPEFVHQGSDDLDDSPITEITDPRMWNVVYDRFGVVALQGVKELLDRVEALEAR